MRSAADVETFCPQMRKIESSLVTELRDSQSPKARLTQLVITNSEGSFAMDLERVAAGWHRLQVSREVKEWD